jgi:hypothetical protein
MMTIVLSACLIAHPGQCKDFRVPIDVDMDPGRCTMVAPPYFAKWTDEHPAWRVMRWKCLPANQNDI